MCCREGSIAALQEMPDRNTDKDIRNGLLLHKFNPILKLQIQFKTSKHSLEQTLKCKEKIYKMELIKVQEKEDKRSVPDGTT